MKIFVLGLFLIVAGGTPLYVGVDLSIHRLIHSEPPIFHNQVLAWIATWMPSLSDTEPANCLNNVAYLLAIGSVLLGGYIIAKVVI